MSRGVAFWRKLYFDLANEVEQVLGKALGYPKYSDDQKNFPGTTEADGVCVGEHVPESLLSEAAGKLKPTKFDWKTVEWPKYDWQYNLWPGNWRDVGNTKPFGYNIFYKEKPKPLVFGKEDNTPCTAEIEVAFEKLASYFEKRSKENARRADKEENKNCSNDRSFAEWVQGDRSGYYFSGKADS